MLKLCPLIELLVPYCKQLIQFVHCSVFGEGVVNDAASIVIFNVVQALDFSNIDHLIALKLLWTFLYPFFTTTAFGIAPKLKNITGKTD
uniref:Cation/H+ exchanger domain-containing protein n=1 Tax=Quercus lobata TaxID=97700 RepID=A0A7N2N050_QUELO